ncbi:MAG: hypothetical protein QHH14_10555 [Clostridiales bacterium]|nr:hypothetical protein [Clostridiales bacterium]
MKKISLNLAAHPLRNRRFFYLLSALLGLGLLVSVLFSGQLFVRYYFKAREAREALNNIEASVSTAQREEKRLSSRVQEALKKDKEKIDLVNSIILKKSFSWTEFFSKLEECLPDSSYILSLSPTLVDNKKIQMRFKVVSAGLDDLLALVDKLQSLNFSQIRVENEDTNPQGQLILEISVSYERTL